MDDVVCCGLGRLCMGLQRELGLARGERRGGGACRQSDRRWWRSVAGTESRRDGAADVALPQLYAACHRRQLALLAGACERRQCADDAACCGLRRLCARGCSGRWGLRGASRGAAVACRQSDRRSWGSVTGTESRRDDAADVAGPQRYAACIGWACAVSGCLRTPAVHGWCVLRVGWLCAGL